MEIKILTFLLVLILGWGCKGDVKTVYSETVEKADVIYSDTIYEEKFIFKNLSPNEFNSIQKIGNKDSDLYEELQTPLKDSLLNGTGAKEVYCKNIYLIENSLNYLGHFYIIDSNIKYICFVTYTHDGIILDKLCFKSQERQNGKWNKFFTHFYFINSQSIKINVLDSKQKVAHPSKADIVKVDMYQVDVDGNIVQQ